MMLTESLKFQWPGYMVYESNGEIVQYSASERRLLCIQNEKDLLLAEILKVKQDVLTGSKLSTAESFICL